MAALQYEYSLLGRRVEREILPLAEREGIGVLTWAPLASGFLTDGFDVERLDPEDFRRTHPFASLDLAPLHAALREIAERHDRSVAQVALAWVTAQPAVAGAIVRIRSEAEADALPAAADLQLEPDELRRLASAAP